MSAKLELERLGKSFPGVDALADVSLSIAPGEVHALVGANGAGKSTLIKIISGAYPADAGRMILDGKDFRPRTPADAINRGISTIYQERNWLPGRSVMFNIMLGREAGHHGILDFPAMRARAQEALAMLHAESVPLDAPADTLSVGRRQVVEIARALVRECSLLIMDEPTAALNREEEQALFALVRTLRARGLSIIYISHRLEEVFDLADRVTVLRDGRRELTAAVNAISPDDLIRAMIGRGLDSAFPEKNPAPGPPVLTVSGLGAAAFREVSFTLRRGEVLGITGLEGSGKEELARALFGAVAVKEGTMKIGGERARFDTAWLIGKGLAYLPEDRKVEGMIGELPVRRNISLPLLDRLSTRLGRILKKLEQELAGKWIERLDIKTPSPDEPCRNLSGGNQQKVALARWLAADARVLILAHPTREIDVGVKFELYRLIADLSRQGVAVVLVSADLAEILGLCHTILVMRDGTPAAMLPADRADKETILRYTLGR
ncbi:MAG TPA: sugar ABC transporter ATP-binding protein [bacterium]|nr:sugar ABC transporter ATP-binding protein [bacterium]